MSAVILLVISGMILYQAANSSLGHDFLLFCTIVGVIKFLDDLRKPKPLTYQEKIDREMDRMFPNRLKPSEHAEVRGLQMHTGMCPVCSTKVESPRACEECGTPHHAECWDYNGGCGMYGCGHRAATPIPGKN